MTHVLPRRGLLVGGVVFVVSDAVTFAALLCAATALRVEARDWPATDHALGLLGALSALLLGSSVCLGLARRGRGALLGMIVCALAFVALEGSEWRALLHAQLGPATDLRHASLFVVTALHATHVLVGAGYAISLVARRLRDVTILGLYWLAIDVAWLGILLVVYR